MPDTVAKLELYVAAHLAVITSAEEEAIIVKMQTEKNVGSAWLGIHEQFQKDDWVTTLDQPLNAIGYAHWREGEPNNFENVGEHCVASELTGMNDLPCSRSLAFFCKINFE